MADKSIHNRNNKKETDSLLVSIKDVFDKEIYTQLISFFDSLKGILFVFEKNSKTDYKQSINYTALKLLIRKKKEIAKDIVLSINKAFKYFQQSDYDFFINENLNISNYQKIKLRDNEEDELAIVMQLINKSDETNDKALHLLSNYFSEMSYGKELTFNQIPVSPFVVVNSLLNSIKELDLNSGVRMIVYNTFEVNVILKLSRIYKMLIEKLSAQLVISTQSKKSLIPNNTIDNKYTIIKQLFNRYHKIKKHNPNQKKCISKDLIIQKLNIIQEKIQSKQDLGVNYSLNSINLKVILDKSIESTYKNTNNITYKYSDSDTIHLVSLLFQYISKDKSIHYNLKQLLISLEVAILKVAIHDDEFFKYSSNPVRLLLNQMSYVPDGFNDNLNNSNKYLIKLKEMVAVILVQSSYNSSLYKNLLIELNEFTEKMKKKFNLIQKRIKEKAVGLEKITTVKNHVDSLLDKIMHNHYMPVYVRELLLKTWKNVLVIEFLRHPAESKTCQSKVAFVEMIIKYSRPFKDKNITIDDINELASQYREGLDLVAFNSKDLIDKHKELLNFLIQVHGLKEKVDDSFLGEQHNEVILYIKNEKEINAEKYDNNQILDQFLDKAKALKVGSWLEFRSSKTNSFKAKISWISPNTGKYLLVNSNGVRMADKTANEIATGFRNKTCFELKTIPLIDRALIQIAKSMNQKLKA